MRTRHKLFANKYIIFPALLVSCILLLVTLATSVHAQACVANDPRPQCIIGNITTPAQIKTTGNGEADISTFINNGITILFSVAAVAFVIMVLWSAVSWILSGGDKEAVAKARARLTWAVIGIVILSLAFAILRVLETITGFTFFH